MRTYRFGLLTLLTVALFIVACRGDADPAWGGVVRDSAGIRLVENPAKGMWETGQEWTVTDDLIIGADTLGLPYQFGRIRDIGVGVDGSIYVLDNMAAEVRVFDSMGVHVRTIGRRGAGPGEFTRSAAGVFLTHDERLGVPDLGNTRLNWLDLDGAFVASTPLSYANGFPVRWDDDGTGTIVVQRRAMGGNQDSVLAEGDPLVRIERDGREEHVVVLPMAQTVRMVGSRPQFTYFETEPSWDLGPSGTLRSAMTQEYRIELRGPDGILHTVISKHSPPREVTAEDRDRFTVLMREALARNGQSPDAVDRFLRRMEFGSTLPAFNQIMEGPDGTTLVQRVQNPRDMTNVDLAEEQSRRLGSVEWDAFDSSGRYLGVFRLPARFTPMVWRTDAVFGRWLDDVDRHYVRKLQLARPARSSSVGG